MKDLPPSPPSRCPAARNLRSWWHRTRLLLAVLLLAPVTPGRAANHRGLQVTGAAPSLSLDFGNPTEYAKGIPEPVTLDLGPAGTYFHGTAAARLDELAPAVPPAGLPPYGGPGDSWSEIQLSAPAPGSLALTPVEYRFDSRIRNLSGAVGYWTDNANAGGNVWHFEPPGTRVHFRVDWTIEFKGRYQVTNCTMVFIPIPPYTNVVCTTDWVEGSAVLGSGIGIAGFGQTNIHSGVIGPGDRHLTGTFAGVAEAAHLQVSVANHYYVGQATRGDAQVIVTYRIYADTQPLGPAAAPWLLVTPTPQNTLRFSWSPDFPDFVLQSAANLGGTSWAVTPGGTSQPVEVPLDGPARFFRLVRP